jgi:release factor glutamine methyltransferase
VAGSGSKPPVIPVDAKTVGELLNHGSLALRDAGSETPRLDAELLLAHVLGVGRALVLTESQAPVGAGQAATYTRLIERRATGEPVAYIRGIKEFYGLAFAIDSRSLIPRPETETLVAIALDRIRDQLSTAPRPADAAPLLVWDVGTGSGAIAVALAIECRRRGYGNDVSILATDLSSEALALAVENAVSHGVADVIEFAIGDLTEISDGRVVQPVDVLLANLPYIPSADVPGLPIAASFEPKAALDGGADGLELISRLVGQLPSILAPDGMALLEIGSDQVTAARDIVDSALEGWASDFHDDLGGRPRVLEINRARQS